MMVTLQSGAQVNLRELADLVASIAQDADTKAAVFEDIARRLGELDSAQNELAQKRAEFDKEREAAAAQFAAVRHEVEMLGQTRKIVESMRANTEEQRAQLDERQRRLEEAEAELAARRAAQDQREGAWLREKAAFERAIRQQQQELQKLQEQAAAESRRADAVRAEYESKLAALRAVVI